MTSPFFEPATSQPHPFLDLCLDSDLLDIKIGPAITERNQWVAAEAKSLATSSRSYKVDLWYGTEDGTPTAEGGGRFWVAVDNHTCSYDPDATEFRAMIEALPPEDQVDVIEAIGRLAEIHGSAEKIVADFMGHAQSHVYSRLNDLAAQAGSLDGDDTVIPAWQDALEQFIKTCRAPRLRNVTLKQSPLDVAFIDVSAETYDGVTSRPHTIHVTWTAATSDAPARRLTFDGRTLELASGESDFSPLFTGTPMGSRENFTADVRSVVELGRLAAEVAVAHRLMAHDSPEDLAAHFLRSEAADVAGSEALATLNGLAGLHTSR